MQQTAMSWYVYQITNSKFLLGLVAAIGSAPMVFSSIWGGALADLYPKRSILVATQSAQMICAFLLSAGVWLGFGAMIPLGSLEAGAVAHWAGTPFALAFGAIICAASAVVTLLLIQRREAQLAK